MSAAHPLDDGPAVLLRRDLGETAAQLGPDARSYTRLVQPFLRDPQGLFEDLLAPLRLPRHPIAMARFGLAAVRSAAGLARGRFQTQRAQALFAGCAAHAIQPLTHPLTAALGLIFCLAGHVEPWPVAQGGSQAIADAMLALFRARGGQTSAGTWVRTLADLPPARVTLFDTSTTTLAQIAGPVLPAGYLRRLARYRYGPGVFKVDYALDGPIPWKDPGVLAAPTVHVGGTLDEIAAAEAAMFRGEHPERPFVMLCQQSQLDPSRAPEGKHTGYAYCHVPAGSTLDQTDAIERQIERYAPGFRERILARHTMNAAQFEAYNPAYVGGAVTGGVADWTPVFTRPLARLNPYTTPHPRIFLCSASTPPGGGVHGMCGYYAAQAAARALADAPVAALTDRG